MFCIECGTRNPENAKFCKKCGHPMPKPDLAEQAASESTLALDAQPEAEAVAHSDPAQRARDLLLSAFRLREAGDLDGAFDAALQVVELQPQSVAGHALLSTLHENKGDLDKAIAEREKVLELAPDSEADRDKLEMLRKGVRQAAPRHIISSKPLGRPVLFERRPSPATIGVVAFLAVVIVGSASVLLWNRGADRPPTGQNAQAPAPASGNLGTFAQSPFTAPAAQPGTQQQAPQQQQQTNNASAGNQPPEYDQPPAQRRRQSNTYTGLDENRDVPPAPVAIPSNGGLGQDTRVARQQGDTDPSAFHMPDRNPDGTSSNVGGAGQPPATPPRNPGRIEIVLAPDPTGTARGGSKPSTGGGATITRADSGATMDSRSRRALAQEYQMKGDYAHAATEYKRALEGAGEDVGLIHQKIALCYQRLDQRDSAIAHYNDAIRAYQQMKDAGHNVDLADQGIRASQAGIANCK